jgi:hypothetical protein
MLSIKNEIMNPKAKIVITLALGFAGFLAIAWKANEKNQIARQKDFSEKDVEAIVKLIKPLNPDNYRIVLPSFVNGKQAGQKVYGKYPLSGIIKLGNEKNIVFNSHGNLQMIVYECDGGTGCSSCAGSPPSERTGVTGSNNDQVPSIIIQRLSQFSNQIGRVQYVFLQ